MQELVIRDYVKMLWTGTGAGSPSGLSAISGHRTASAVIADGVPWPYTIWNPDVPTERESGIAVMTAGVMTRRVCESTNGNDVVNFSAGNKQIALARHAAIVGFNKCLWGTGGLGNLTISGATVVTLTEDAYYLKVDFAAATTGRIDTNGFTLFCLDEFDARNMPAGGCSAVNGAWGTVGGGGFNNDSAETISFGYLGGSPAIGGRSGIPIGSIPWGVDLVGVVGGVTDAATAANAGGVLQVAARRIRRDGTTAAGAFRANGAADGSGGRVRIAYGELLGSTKTGAIHASAAGEAGDSAGVVETFNLWAGTSTFAGRSGSTTQVDL